jgi:hypothetical protein
VSLFKSVFLDSANFGAEWKKIGNVKVKSINVTKLEHGGCCQYGTGWSVLGVTRDVHALQITTRKAAFLPQSISFLNRLG